MASHRRTSTRQEKTYFFKMKYFCASFSALNASVTNYSFLAIYKNLSLKFQFYLKMWVFMHVFVSKSLDFHIKKLLVLLWSLCAPNFLMFMIHKSLCSLNANIFATEVIHKTFSSRKFLQLKCKEPILKLSKHFLLQVTFKKLSANET